MDVLAFPFRLNLGQGDCVYEAMSQEQQETNGPQYIPTSLSEGDAAREKQSKEAWNL